jgi:hypothetical protein
VTEAGLDNGVQLCERLFTALEERGHVVRLANAEEAFHRHDVDEREVRKPKDHNGRYHLWRPQRPTVVLLGTAAIGLTIVELSEHAHVRYMDGEYVRETPAIAKRALISRKHSWTTWKDIPTGRFSVIAYSPYPVAKWSEEWRESTETPSLDVDTISAALENAIPRLKQLIKEGTLEAERQRKEWEEQHERWKRAEEAKRKAERVEKSRTELLAIIEEWAASKRLESFFIDATLRLKDLPEPERTTLELVLNRARAMIGATDPLQRLKLWESPPEL